MRCIDCDNEFEFSDKNSDLYKKGLIVRCLKCGVSYYINPDDNKELELKIVNMMIELSK